MTLPKALERLASERDAKLTREKTASTAFLDPRVLVRDNELTLPLVAGMINLRCK